MAGSGSISSIEIGPVRVTVESDSSWIHRSLRSEFGPFITGSGAGLRLRVTTFGEPDASCEGGIQVRRRGEELTASRGDLKLRLGMNGGAGEASILEGSLPGVRVALRFAFTVRGLCVGAILLHAAATRFRDRGWVFPGRSGAGKTTLMRRLASHRKLTDETALIARHDGRWRVFATPFGGDFGLPEEPDSAPVDAIMFIEKDLRSELRQIDRLEAVYRILQHTMGWGLEDRCGRVLDLATELTEACESFVLRLSLDADPEPLIGKRFNANLSL